MTETPPARHSRKGLYAPFILVLIVLAGWTGWWFYLTRQIDTRLEAQVQTLRQGGWTVVTTTRPSPAGRSAPMSCWIAW